MVLLALFQAVISEIGFFYIFKYIIYNVTINIFYFIQILYILNIYLHFLYHWLTLLIGSSVLLLGDAPFFLQIAIFPPLN